MVPIDKMISQMITPEGQTWLRRITQGISLDQLGICKGGVAMKGIDHIL